MDQELYCIQWAKDVTVASWQMADAVAVNSGQIILQVWRHIKNLTVSRLHRNLSLVFHFLVLCFPLSDNRYYWSCFFRSSNFRSSIFSTPHRISSRSDFKIANLRLFWRGRPCNKTNNEMSSDIGSVPDAKTDEACLRCLITENRILMGEIGDRFQVTAGSVLTYQHI